MRELEARLRAATISLLLTLGFIAGWPRVSPRVLEKLPAALAKPLEQLPALQQRLLAPFAPMAYAFGIYGQNWALFSTTGGTRNRLCIEGRRADASDFRLLYRIHDPEHRYLAATLEYRRFRNIWNPHRGYLSSGYDSFAQWVLRRTLADHPELEEARVYMEEGEILARGRGFQANGKRPLLVALRRTGERP